MIHMETVIYIVIFAMLFVLGYQFVASVQFRREFLRLLGINTGIVLILIIVIRMT